LVATLVVIAPLVLAGVRGRHLAPSSNHDSEEEKWMESR
jgi:hypothetical protein